MGLTPIRERRALCFLHGHPLSAEANAAVRTTAVVADAHWISNLKRQDTTKLIGLLERKPLEKYCIKSILVKNQIWTCKSVTYVKCVRPLGKAKDKLCLTQYLANH